MYHVIRNSRGSFFYSTQFNYSIKLIKGSLQAYNCVDLLCDVTQTIIFKVIEFVIIMHEKQFWMCKRSVKHIFLIP